MQIEIRSETSKAVQTRHQRFTNILSYIIFQRAKLIFYENKNDNYFRKGVDEETTIIKWPIFEDALSVNYSSFNANESLVLESDCHF